MYQIEDDTVSNVKLWERKDDTRRVWVGKLLWVGHQEIGGRDIWLKVFYSWAGHESQDRTYSAKDEKEGWVVDHADLQENIIGSADKFASCVYWKYKWKRFMLCSLQQRKFTVMSIGKPLSGTRNGSRYQIGWIFGKIPKDHRPAPLIFGNYVAIFFGKRPKKALYEGTKSAI